MGQRNKSLACKDKTRPGGMRMCWKLFGISVAEIRCFRIVEMFFSEPLYHYISATMSSGWSNYPKLLSRSRPTLKAQTGHLQLFIDGIWQPPLPSPKPFTSSGKNLAFLAYAFEKVTRIIWSLSLSQLPDSLLPEKKYSNSITMWLSISNAIHYQQCQVFHSKLRWFWLRSTWHPKCLHAVDPL